jgi:hypothetical protein
MHSSEVDRLLFSGLEHLPGSEVELLSGSELEINLAHKSHPQP